MTKHSSPPQILHSSLTHCRVFPAAFPDELWECKGCKWAEFVLRDIAGASPLFHYRNCLITVIHSYKKMIYGFRSKHLKMHWMPFFFFLFLDNMWFQSSRACFRKQEIFSMGDYIPKRPCASWKPQLRHLLAYVYSQEEIYIVLPTLHMHLNHSQWRTRAGDVCRMNYRLDGGRRSLGSKQCSSVAPCCMYMVLEFRTDQRMLLVGRDL